jgi:hypothetical protein
LNGIEILSREADIQMKTVESRNATATIMRQTKPFFSKEKDQHFFGSSKNESTFFPGSDRRNSFIQHKLEIGQPDDAYEKEADRVAERVVNNIANSASNQDNVNGTSEQSGSGNEERKIRKFEEKAEGTEVKKLNRKPIFDSGAEPPDDDNSIRKKPENSASQNTNHSIETGLTSSKGSGSPLPVSTREQMESSIGADFSGVRIHNDPGAAQMSKDLNAQAFTHGNDIYFNSGKYDTRTSAGKHLLAHELAHTVQQSGNADNPAMPKIQKKSQNDFSKATPEELEAAGKKCEAGYVFRKGATGKRDFHIKKLSSKKYKLQDEAVQLFRDKAKGNGSVKGVKMPKPGTRKTKQDTIWKSNVRDNAKASLKKVAKIDDKDTIDTDALYSLRAKGGKPSYKGIIGTFTQITNEVLVPNWDYNGNPNIYQIEHMVDWQIMGEAADNIKNLILLEARENNRVADKVEEAISDSLMNIARHYAKQFTKVPASTKEIRSKFDCFVDDIDESGKNQAKKDIYYSKALTDETEETHPYKEKIVKVTEAQIPKGHFLLTSSDKRAAYILPKNAKRKEIGAFFVTVDEDGGKIKSISFENRLTKKKVAVGVDKKLKTKAVK